MAAPPSASHLMRTGLEMLGCTNVRQPVGNSPPDADDALTTPSVDPKGESTRSQDGRWTSSAEASSGLRWHESAEVDNTAGYEPTQGGDDVGAGTATASASARASLSTSVVDSASPSGKSESDDDDDDDVVSETSDADPADPVRLADSADPVPIPLGHVKISVERRDRTRSRSRKMDTRPVPHRVVPVSHDETIGDIIGRLVAAENVNKVVLKWGSFELSPHDQKLHGWKSGQFTFDIGRDDHRIDLVLEVPVDVNIIDDASPSS